MYASMNQSILHSNNLRSPLDVKAKMEQLANENKVANMSKNRYDMNGSSEFLTEPETERFGEQVRRQYNYNKWEQTLNINSDHAQSPMAQNQNDH